MELIIPCLGIIILTFENALPSITSYIHKIPVKESTIIPNLQMGKLRALRGYATRYLVVELDTRSSASAPDSLLCLL